MRPGRKTNLNEEFPLKLGLKILLAFLFFVVLYACSKSADKKNVIIISIDTLRADHASIYGYSRKTTPQIDSFAKKSIVFDRAYTQASHTLPSHTTLLTSVYPDTHGLFTMPDTLSEKIETLTQILSRQGYETAAFLNAGWLHPKFGLDRGFETYNFYTDTRIEESNDGIKIGRNAEDTNKAVFEWLAESDKQRPFFLFAHYFDVHSDWKQLPYESPQPYGTKFCQDYRGNYKGGRNGIFATKHLMKLNKKNIPLSNEDRKYIEALYDGGVAYTDNQIGILLKKLEDMNLLENSLVIIISDHGEEFREHGQFLHEQIYEEQIHVLLIMKFPDKGISKGSNAGSEEINALSRTEAVGRRIKTPVKLIDIMPTILDYLKIEKPAHVQGSSFFPVIKGEKLTTDSAICSRNSEGTQYSIIDGFWKLLYKVPDKKTLLFNLENDPSETNDLSASEPERTAKLRNNLLKHITTYQNAGKNFRFGKIELDDRIKDELKALGYVN